MDRGLGCCSRLELGEKVVGGAVEGLELAVLGLGYVYTVLLSKLHHYVEEVHGIQVQLIPQADFGLDVRQVLVGGNLGNDVEYDLSDLFFVHSSVEGLCNLILEFFQDKNGIDSKHAK